VISRRRGGILDRRHVNESGKGPCDWGKALWIGERFLRSEEDLYASEMGFILWKRVFKAFEGFLIIGEGKLRSKEGLCALKMVVNASNGV